MKLYKYIFLSALLLCCVASRGQFNPSNPPEPNALYSLTVQSNPKGAGSVYGGGKYASGKSVNVYAYNNSGFKFKSWKKGDTVISTSSSFYYTTEAQDVTLTAYFEYDPTNPAEPNPIVLPVKHKLYLETNPKNAGSCNISSGNSYEEGQSIYLYAYTNTGFKFKEWQKDGNTLSTDRNYYYQMGTEDATIKAIYYYDPGNPSEPNTPTGVEHGLIALAQQGDKGQTIAYPIYLLNHNIDIYSATFNITFPEGSVVNTTQAMLSSRKNGHDLSITSIESKNNSYQINISNTTSQPFLDSNGILLTIPVTFPESWNVGQIYPVAIENVVLGGTSGNVNSTAKNGSLSLNASEAHNVYASFHPDQFLNRVMFTNLSSDNADTYSWSFGDGTTSTEKNPFHIYTSEGNYEVKLAVSNDYASDTSKINIRVNPENMWKMSGTFSLNKNKTDVKNFTSLEDFFTLLSKSTINGDITVSTQAGEMFELLLSTETSSLLSSVSEKLKQGNYNILFTKEGEGINPSISLTGLPNAETIAFIQTLSGLWILDNVDLYVFGIKIDISAVNNIKSQTICSGNTTTEVDFSVISTGLSYQWSLINSVNHISGHTSSGTGDIPSMTLVNNTMLSDTLKYKVGIKLGILTLFETEYRIVVLPLFSGDLKTISPSIDETLYTTKINYSWESVGNALYDLYVWKTGETMPETPLAKDLTSTTYTNNSFCQYGESYSWKVVANGGCNSIESAVASFSIRRLPDLKVSQVSLPENMQSGRKYALSYTITNDSEVEITGSWSDRVYLSNYNSLSAGSYTTLGTIARNNVTIPAGSDISYEFEITAPTDTLQKFYYHVATDVYNSILESDENNNILNSSDIIISPDIMDSEDYQLLKALYTAMNGFSWNNKWNINTNRITPNNWHGVQFLNGKVVSINLNNNGLSGNIPAELFAFSQIKEINLGNNALTGNIPATIANTQTITSLILNNNSLSGTIPDVLGNLANLVTLNLSNNKLTGTAPTSLNNLSKLKTLNLSYNSIDQLAEAFGFDSNTNIYIDNQTVQYENALIIDGNTIKLQLPNICTYNISGKNFNAQNGFTIQVAGETKGTATANTLGELTFSASWVENIGENDKISIVQTNGNAYNTSLIFTAVHVVTTPVPDAEYQALVAFYGVTGGDSWIRQWTVSKNNLHLQPWTGVGILDGHIVSIELPSNNLVGTIPAVLSNLPQLQKLDLQGNSLTVIETVLPSSILSLAINGQIFNKGNLAFNGSFSVDMPNIYTYDHANQNFGVVPMFDVYVSSTKVNKQSLSSTGVETFFNNIGEDVKIPVNATIEIRQTNGTTINSSLNYTAIYDSGDSNVDGLVNILDIQQTLNHILIEKPVPFNFMAADLNADSKVNVQDIALTVNLIQSSPLQAPAGLRSASESGTQLYIENGIVYLDTKTEITGLDIRLSQDSNNDVKSLIGDMQVSIHETGNQISVLAFSIAGNAIPVGKTALCSIAVNQTIEGVLLSDKQARPVECRIVNAPTGINTQQQEKLNLFNAPNPFKEKTEIIYYLNENISSAQIKIYDTSGRMVDVIKDLPVNQGENRMTYTNSKLAAGLYFYELEVLKEGKLYLKESNKMLIEK